MSEFKSYKDLLIWSKSKDLSLQIYQITKTFPKEEQFGLISQIRRSAISIPSNIAEGWGRDSENYFINFLNIAKGSLYELETQLIISKELEFISNEKLLELSNEIDTLSRMIIGLIKKINHNKSLKK
jgi:four helix bundle protein